ncbi:MAG TPA: peptidoglycan DD-metalloendopeptidase family protein [Xanthobacteraceae bacterium]|jgi:septal ring factor EnvC (AmiA/AmiB activator)|nr:peptidoglycan DD-metalloendopeptidase family protein [Xanthobacteraceae bacterium]
MILRHSIRTDSGLVLGSALALALPFGFELGGNSAAFAQSAPVQLPAAQAPSAQAPAAQPPTAQTPAPPANNANALKQRDQELGAALAQQRSSVENQAKLKIEIETLSDDRRKFNQQLIDTAARIRDVEANIDATQARLTPLDDKQRLFARSLDERRSTIIEILAALQRIGRQPPPALMVRPEDALQAVRTAITLGAVVPEMRAQADALAGDLSDLLQVRKQIVDERDRLTKDVEVLGREQLRMTLLIEQRQKKQAIAEQALDAEHQHAADLAHQVDTIKDLIAKLEADLDPATRAKRDSARSIESDAIKPNLAALGDPGRLSPAVAFADMRGHLRLPVNGTRIRDFGGSDGSGGTQKGLSIAARPGAQITAPCDGWVVYAGAFRSYGQLLILNAGGGYHVLLAGMKRISVDLGQFVLTGEPVAVMGDASQASATVATVPKQPVLYVEFRKDGTPIDPSPWWATNEGEKVRG